MSFSSVNVDQRQQRESYVTCRQSISSYSVGRYYNYTVVERLLSKWRVWDTKHDVAGSIPAAWEQAGAFPVLQTLYFSNTLLSGMLPSAWGSQAALHELQSLIIISCNFTGKSAVFADSDWSCQTTSQCILLICDAQSSLDAWLANAGL